MASSSDTARAYFAALSARDLEGALALWRPGGRDHLPGQGPLTAPDELRAFLEDLWRTFPDWDYEILETTTYRERCVVRWRVTATFAGPGRLHGYAPNGRRLDLEGCDILLVEDGRIAENHVYMDRAEMLAQVGVPVSAAVSAHPARTLVTNAGRSLSTRLAGGEAKVIAPGVWLLQGGFPTTMNVYLLAEPDGGVTVFDGGIRSMTPALAAAGARLGGIRRVVLGHADCDHRGAIAGLDGVPILCHPLEVAAASSAEHQRDYWQLDELGGLSRRLFPVLFRIWDGGALAIAGTVSEGDEVAGFRVIELPGHAPGLIGLYREEDGLVLCSDCLYTINAETGVPGGPRVPHVAFNQSTEVARESLLKLAGLSPKIVWPGHARPVSGPGVPERLADAARG